MTHLQPDGDFIDEIPQDGIECIYCSRAQFVDLNNIEYNFCDRERYKHWFDVATLTGKIKPIRICSDATVAKYSIIEGHHRCQVSKDLGYSHIPAFVETIMTYKNPE